VVEVYGTFGYILNIIALTIAALFEEFGGDESTEAEMVNVSREADSCCGSYYS
jgi:hypothetical protein